MHLTAKERVKEILFSDKEQLIYILEELGCYKIDPNFSANEIRCALPDGVTATSVSIKIEPHLPCMVFSRSGYGDYKVKDIITLVQFIRNTGFKQAVSWLCTKLKIQEDSYDNTCRTLDVVRELRSEKRRRQRKSGNYNHQPLPKDILEQYEPCVVNTWLMEGISSRIQRKYGIRNDRRSKRWLIPIYDENDNLISIKARTYAPNWELLGMPKYIYYFPLGVSDILYGMNFNKAYVKEKDEIVLFEAEKSVMAADSYGYNWCSAVGTNGITKPLKKKILATKCKNCVLAFDKDVSYNDLLKEARKLNKYMNVYIIYDKFGLLGAKESPTDRGKETWVKLYNSRIRVR